MEVDEVPRLPKWNRGEEERETEQDDKEWEGDENNDEDGKVVQVNPWGPKKGRGQTGKLRGRRLPMPIPKYYKRCQTLDRPCQAQEAIQACYPCAKVKKACQGGKGPLYNSLGLGAKLAALQELVMAQAGPTDGEQESPKEQLAQKSDKKPGKRNLHTSS